jgi:GNAT superfamily N-acetyltransferase
MRPITGPSQSTAIRPATLSDLQAVLHVRQAQEVSDSGTPMTTAGYLTAEWEALGPRLAEQTWVVVTTDGSLLACAELVHEDGVFVPRLWVLPDHRESGLEMALLDRVEQWACATRHEEGAASVTFFAQATSAHPAAQQALLRSGFVVTSTYEKMDLVLREPPATPKVIADIEIRPFAVGHDAEMVYRADEEAFQDQRGHMPRTFERWSQRLNLGGETHDPSLWLIAWDADAVAGVALGEVVRGVGWIHHLSVRRPWRRRGLGAALMLSALGAFYRRGVGAVRLNVDAQSLTNAHQLYRRLGFSVIGTYCNYEKTVPRG